MISKRDIEIEIKCIERQYNFTEGYHLLYSPWDTLDFAEIVFISLNPGRSRTGQEQRILSDERGNSFEVERFKTVSPLTDQFLKLAAFLSVTPKDILTGTAHPFRSNRWSDFSREQRLVGLDFGKRFWSRILNNKRKLVITLGDQATRIITSNTDAQIEQEINSGWGAIKLRRYSTSLGFPIVQLPHLSTFRIFSRKESEAALTYVFGTNFSAVVPTRIVD